MLYHFLGTFAVVFALIYRWREFPLSVVANRFELGCQLNKLLLLKEWNCTFFE